jgi:hypothetical protein
VVRWGLAGGGAGAGGRGCCGHWGGAGHAACSSRVWGRHDGLWGDLGHAGVMQTGKGRAEQGRGACWGSVDWEADEGSRAL